MVCQTPSESTWMQNGRPVSTPYHTLGHRGPINTWSSRVNGSHDEKSDWTQCLPTLQRSWSPIFRPNRAFFLYLDFALRGANPLNWRMLGFEPTLQGCFLCCGLIDWLHESRMGYQTPSESSLMQNSGLPTTHPRDKTLRQ